TGLEAFVDSQPKMGERLMNGRSVWETIRFVLTQPRNCHIRSIYFEGPTREKLAVRS
ncbi:TPA: deoxygluconate dehydrogenase, partial [Klebsiella pneumoniae]|nr:deoxygluconate dehydrogenase [Klebsiella pneumoniae]HBQ8423264.1 deoxygluconate dehydrogenase [Klebsiella pneumoniae]HBS7295905.1 deoxygluconate dehydrogenase [Klebsiella pneumoniae]